ncbi:MULTISPECIES: hypothetical protein [Clostridia]|uniref:hypothetical protein n=1 Tax=Clostridia TaxID=186801 RepID=UPI001FA99A5A|nr:MULTISPECIES: hypothetical protein [Clostridia]
MERIKVENISYFYQNKYQTIEAVKKVSCTFESGKNGKIISLLSAGCEGLRHLSRFPTAPYRSSWTNGTGKGLRT